MGIDEFLWFHDIQAREIGGVPGLCTKVIIDSQKPWTIPKSYATSNKIQRSFAALRMTIL